MCVGVRRPSESRVPSVTVSPTPRSTPFPSCSLATPRFLRQTFTTRFFVLLLLLSGTLSPPLVSTLPLSSFYPFNSTAGDNATNKTDDGGSGKITLLQQFPFFGKRHDKLFVNNNGVITFLKELTGYRPVNFPLQETPLIAPYWADVDVAGVGGTVWFRETVDTSVLRVAEKEIRKYSNAYRTFRANWTFIATWDNVGFYGAQQEGKNRRNIFQAALVSDGVLSFVILNYNKIQWTTGSNSQGNQETGLGGMPAQAGFNAGDGINFYEIEGARTDNVINLTLTSNVGIPGKWIFRVDAPEIQGFCSPADSGHLYISPQSGDMLGGYAVKISGPCFNSSRLITGLVVEANVTFPCVEMSETAYCVMPTLFVTGHVTITVLLDQQQYNYTGNFTLVNTAQTNAKVIRHSPQDWRANQNAVEVSWNKDNLPFQEQALVEVLAYSYTDGQPKLEVVGRPVTASINDTSVSLILPELKEITLAVVRVKVPNSLLNGSYLFLWSDVFPVRWRDPATSDTWCWNWLKKEQDEINLTFQADCPCTRRQAERDSGRWQLDPLCSSLSTDVFNCIYRGTQARECIVPTYRGTQNQSQLCCYGDNEELLDVREGGGGSMLERYHYRSQRSQNTLLVPWFSYLQEDVAPYLHCCEFSANASLCADFRQYRAPVACSSYISPAAAQAAGDPHLVTLDGLSYTFNGEGDYVLMQSDTDTLQIHVHASRARDIDGQEQNVTVFTSVAMAVRNETDVVEIRKDDDDFFLVLVNREEFLISDPQTELTGMTIYYQVENTTRDFRIVMDSAGVSVLVSVTEDLLNIMVLVGEKGLRGHLRGLLGNFNGVKDDDFISHSGQLIPSNASMEDIHYGFGMSWLLDRNETLLDSTIGSESSQTTGINNYVPIFINDRGQENTSRNGTNELCQDNIQCQFDLDVTRNERIAKSTKQFSEEFQKVISEIAPVIRCPYLMQIDNGNRTLSGQTVGSTAVFICDKDFQAITSTTVLVCLSNGNWNGTVPECVQKIEPGTEILNQVLYLAIGGGVGGFVLIFLAAIIIRCIFIRCHRRYSPPSKSDTGSEPEQSIDLPVIFAPSDIPNPVFENPLFLSSLQKLKSDRGKFHIPRPTYVDPNIYTEYF